MPNFSACAKTSPDANVFMPHQDYNPYRATHGTLRAVEMPLAPTMSQAQLPVIRQTFKVEVKEQEAHPPEGIKSDKHFRRYRKPKPRVKEYGQTLTIIPKEAVPSPLTSVASEQSRKSLGSE